MPIELKDYIDIFSTKEAGKLLKDWQGMECMAFGSVGPNIAPTYPFGVLDTAAWYLDLLDFRTSRRGTSFR